MKIIVTGGAGFIGSNIVKALNDKGITDILVVDNLKDGTKFVNLVDLNIADYLRVATSIRVYMLRTFIGYIYVENLFLLCQIVNDFINIC